MSGEVCWCLIWRYVSDCGVVVLYDVRCGTGVLKQHGGETLGAGLVSVK